MKTRKADIAGFRTFHFFRPAQTVSDGQGRMIDQQGVGIVGAGLLGLGDKVGQQAERFLGDHFRLL